MRSPPEKRSRPRSGRRRHPALPAIVRYWSAMPGTKRLVRHLSVASVAIPGIIVLALLAASFGSRTIHAQDAGSTSNFVITFGGARIGAERVTVSRPGGAFKITMIGQIGPRSISSRPGSS